MAARSLRRRFATPFVMTLAACGGTPAPSRPSSPDVQAKPAYFEATRWLVSKTDDACEAQMLVPCNGEACNPPRPVRYPCLDGDEEKNIKRVSATECVLELIPTTKVPCPKD